MNFPRTSLLAALVLGAFVAGAGPLAAKSVEQERAKVDQMAAGVLQEIYAQKPGLEQAIKKAEGYAVFSNVGVNLIFASFAGGHGVVVKRGGDRTYMKMGSAGIGLGLGIKDFRAVFVFRSKARLQAFVDKGWDFSGQADATAKSDDKGAGVATAGSVIEDVEVYQVTKNGLALQATLQGTKYWKDDLLND